MATVSVETDLGVHAGGDVRHILMYIVSRVNGEIFAVLQITNYK